MALNGLRWSQKLLNVECLGYYWTLLETLSSIVFKHSPINHLFLARGFVIEKFSKVFIDLKKSIIVKGVTHAVALVDAEPLLNR